jgi:exodeoxyribonuclease VII small subunit
MAGRKTSATQPAAEQGPSFEEALERLETIVEQLESGELSLEQSIASYEEGVKLSRRLGATLDEAEKRIERLVGGETEDAPTTEPMDLDERVAESPPPRGPRTLVPPPVDEGKLPF